MKRLIALLLAFVIPFTTIGSVVAETLHLPVDLKDIEEETFGYTLSLGEVDVAFGTETIGSKAFVNSGLSKIYIPATVSYIAPDAFDGTNVSIVTPDGTHAKEFADEHGFAWEDGSDHYKKDTLEAAKDYLESEEEADSIVMEDAEVTLLSTEGITDEAQLAEIEAINEKLLAYYAAVEQYSARIDELNNAIAQLDEGVASARFDVTDDQLSFTMGDLSYSVSANEEIEKIGDDYEIVSTEMLADGTVRTELISGGVTYYLDSNERGMTVAAQNAASSSAGSVFSVSAASAGDFQIIDTVLGILDTISYAVSTIDTVLGRLEFDAQAVYDAAEEALNKFNNHTEDPAQAAEYAKLKQKLEGAQKYLQAVQKLKNIWRGLGFAGSIYSIYGDVSALRELKGIMDHGHPIVEEAADEERIALIDRMNVEIQCAWALYVADAVLNLANIVSEIASFLKYLGVVNPTGLIAAIGMDALSRTVKRLLIVYAVQAVSSVQAGKHLDAAKEIDQKLHSFVFGKITDQETQEAIANTAVTNGSTAVLSDGEGKYKIYLLPGEHTLVFRAEGYKKEDVPVVLGSGYEYEQNVQLIPIEASIFGTVTDSATRELLEGVQITCGEHTHTTDATGTFSFKVEPGQYPMTFYKVGYARFEDTFTVEEDQSLELEIKLEKSYIITNREELEAVANDVMGNYTLGNSIELGDEPWTPLPWFSGTLDGAGYSINGMQLTEGVAGENNAGLFVGLYNGHVSNLTMNSVNVEMTAQGSMLGIGAICGGLNNGSSLTNCKVNGTVNVTADTSNNSVYVGGLAGIGDTGYITDCYSGANVSIVTPNIGHAGGLAGMLGGGQARNSDAAGSVTVVQSGSNSGASLNAFGTMYTSGIISDDCNAGGNVSAHSTNGFASAYGTVNANNSLNTASVSASTESGNATARGAYGGENSSNNSGILATATGSGHSVAIGLHGVNGGKNIGSITARAASGSAMARGGESVGSNVTNSGNVTAESVSGGSNAGGIYGQGSSSKNCSNSGSVTATGDTNQALAIGMNSCAESQNTGRVSATSTKGDAVGQGMTSCASSTNYGDVDVTYVGEDDAEGGLSAQGLNSCTNSTNVGSVTGTVKASTTACTVSGTSGGSGNVNQGAVTATSSSGPANARGVRSSNSQNYGTVYARTSAENTGNDLCNATAYGTDASGSFNGGDVTAISENGGAHAYGHHGGGSSSGSVSAVSNFFMTGTDENGIDYGWIGVAHAYNSTSVQASVAGHSVSASGGNEVNLYYFFAASNCEDHMGMNRGFVSYEKGGEPDDFDGCFVHVGTASSDAN